MKTLYFIFIFLFFISITEARAKKFTEAKKVKFFIECHYEACNNSIPLTELVNDNTDNNILFNLLPSVLTRGPYLQVGTQTSIIIRWRTDIAENSRVTWGTVFGSYLNTVDSSTSTTEHIVKISGLTADTKYWYTIGSSTQTLQATNTNYFLTLPTSNPNRKLRFVALGDCGNASVNQIAVKNTFINFIGSNDVDAMILLGDNAYNSGTDPEFQTNYFDIYKNDILKYYKLYPAPGNHDYGNNPANTGKTGATPALSMPYHNNFTVPMAGEIGGVPSGVKNYYSFNIGEVHFISLDSYGKDDANTTKMYDTTGAQATWLKADLAANTQKWTIAYFHHPPYTKTSHTSDTELDLVAVREKFVRILERFGVDLVICGHSHGYERSYLLKGFYNTYASPLLDANFNAVSHTATGTMQNAKYDGTVNACPYKYNSGQYNHGSVYVVSGSAGMVGGTTLGYPHDGMYYSNPTNGGCFYFEVDSNRLDAKFISYTTAPTPIVRDQFTIFKDVNKTQNINAVLNDPLTLTASWKGNFYWPNNDAATTRSVTINNNTIGTFTYSVTDASSGSCIQDVFNVTVSGALPVAINWFKASLQKNNVMLNWSTSQENNSQYFTIHKSTDGVHFSFLGKLGAAGTSTVVHSYQLVDHNPFDGTNYYRLSLKDNDGKTNNFEIKSVYYRAGNNFSADILNKGNGRVSVAIHSTQATKVKMKVFDIIGKEILQESFSVNNGGGLKDVYLKNGVYVFVFFNDKAERISYKVIVQ